MIARGASAAMAMAEMFLSNKWVLLVACLWIQSCGGNSYNFAIYSAALKKELGYDQTMLDQMAVAKDVGGNVGIISGFLYEVLPPWAVLLIGAAQNLIGYLGLWLIVTARISPPPLWVTSALICLGTNGATFFNTAVLVTCLRTFRNRGMLLGLLKGFIGLSGAIFTQIYVALYAPDQRSFLLLIALAPTLVAVLLSPLVYERPPAELGREQALETSMLSRLYGASLVLAGLLLVAMLTRELYPDNTRWGASLTAGIVGVLFALVLAPLRAWYTQEAGEQPEEEHLLGSKIEPSEARGGDDAGAREVGACDREANDREEGRGPGFRSTESEEIGARTSLGGQYRGQACMDEGVEVKEVPRSPVRGDDHTLLQAVRGVDFWLLALSQVIGAGCGLTAINNLAQVGSALGQAHSVTVFVGLVNIWSFLGRLSAGAVSEYYVRKKGAPRPLFLLLVQLAMAAAHLLFASALPGTLHVGSVLAGLTYGGQWALMAATASELFGLAHFGTIYNWLAMGSPLSTYLLSVCVAGWIYDREARRGARRGAELPLGRKVHISPGDSLHAGGEPDLGLAARFQDGPLSGLLATLGGERKGLLRRLVGTDPFLFRSSGSLKEASAPQPHGPPTCKGAHCFRLTFLILAGVCLLGSAVNGWLTLRTRTFYRKRWHESIRKETNYPKVTMSESP